MKITELTTSQDLDSYEGESSRTIVHHVRRADFQYIGASPEKGSVIKAVGAMWRVTAACDGVGSAVELFNLVP